MSRAVDLGCIECGKMRCARIDPDCREPCEDVARRDHRLSREADRLVRDPHKIICEPYGREMDIARFACSCGWSSSPFSSPFNAVHSQDARAALLEVEAHQFESFPMVVISAPQKEPLKVSWSEPESPADWSLDHVHFHCLVCGAVGVGQHQCEGKPFAPTEPERCGVHLFRGVVGLEEMSRVMGEPVACSCGKVPCDPEAAEHMLVAAPVDLTAITRRIARGS